MPTTIYSGKVLLTPTYCRKEIDRLTDRYHLMSPPFWGEKAEKRDRILNSLSYYEEIQKSLNDLENLSLDELLKFIAQQIAWKIKEHSSRKISSVDFWKESDYSVRIDIRDVFSVYLTFGQKLYDVDWMYNEHYDGYHDHCEYVSQSTPNAYFNDIQAKLKDFLHMELPDKELRFIIY